jgi:putative exporter of polyketide antibiotics
MVKIPRFVFLSAAIAVCGALLKIGVRQTMSYEGDGLWTIVGGGLIGLGAVILIAALASRKEPRPP